MTTRKGPDRVAILNADGTFDDPKVYEKLGEHFGELSEETIQDVEDLKTLTEEGRLSEPSLNATYDAHGLLGADITQMERQGASARLASNGAALVAYQDCTEGTENWTDLSGWANTGVQTVSNRLYSVSGAAPSGTRRAFPVATNEVAQLRARLHYDSGTKRHLYVGVDCGTADATPEVGSPDAVMAGFLSTSGYPTIYIGSDNGGTGGQARDTVAAATGDYQVTVTVTLDDVTIAIVSESDPTKQWEGRHPRNLLSSGGAITNLIVYNADNRGSGGSANFVYAGMVWRKAISPRPRATTVASGASTLATVQTSIYNRPSADTAERQRVSVPASYDPRKGAPLVVFCHQLSGDATTPFSLAAMIPVTAALLNAGYIVASAQAGGESWGNNYGLACYANLHAWVRSQYAITSTHLIGISMGGLVAANLLARRTIPGVCSFQSVGGAFDLHMNYVGAYAASITTAYSISGDYDAKTAGHDPMLRGPQEFRGVPMRLVTSLSDTSVDHSQTDNFAALCDEAGPVTVTYGTGGHLDAAQFVAADFVAFCEAHR